MNTVLRAVLVYLILMAVLRIAGKRTLSEVSTFDFVLLLVISETTQQALVGDDFSITNAAILIVALVGMEILVSMLETRLPSSKKVTEGLPVVLVENGTVFMDRMRRARVGVDDVLQQARVSHGLQNLDEIKYVVLEHSGGLSIVPKRE